MKEGGPAPVGGFPQLEPEGTYSSLGLPIKRWIRWAGQAGEVSKGGGRYHLATLISSSYWLQAPPGGAVPQACQPNDSAATG